MPGLIVLIFCVLGYAAFCPGDEKLPQLLKLGATVGGVAFAVKLVGGWIAEQMHLHRHVHRLKQLDAFAGRLVKGTTDGRGFYSGGITTVSGQLDGRAIELLVRLGPRSTIAFELRVPDSLQIDAHRPSLPAFFLGSGPVVALARGAPRSEMDALLRALIFERGLGRVVAGGGRLRAEKSFHDSNLRLEWLVDTARTLGRLARLAQLHEAKTTPCGVGKLELSLADSGEERCPFCHGALELPREALTECATCKTAHHKECYSEAGGCTVFGCRGAGSALRELGVARSKPSPTAHNFLGERSRARP